MMWRGIIYKTHTSFESNMFPKARSIGYLLSLLETSAMDTMIIFRPCQSAHDESIHSIS